MKQIKKTLFTIEELFSPFDPTHKCKAKFL